jgi:hypothetical protein
MTLDYYTACSYSEEDSLDILYYLLHLRKNVPILSCTLYDTNPCIFRFRSNVLRGAPLETFPRP